MKNSKNPFVKMFVHLAKRMINYLTDCLIGKIGVVHWNNSFRMNCTENREREKKWKQRKWQTDFKHVHVQKKHHINCTRQNDTKMPIEFGSDKESMSQSQSQSQGTGQKERVADRSIQTNLLFTIHTNKYLCIYNINWQSTIRMRALP